jgi:hypothetical protein
VIPYSDKMVLVLLEALISELKVLKALLYPDIAELYLPNL